MKICKDCKHVQALTPQLPADIWNCRLGAEVSLVDGTTFLSRPGDSKFCAMRRLPSGACKPEGLQWESVQ